MIDETLVMPFDSGNPALARRRALGCADAWDAAVDRDTLVLLVSELLTNAVEHGAPPCGLRFGWHAGVLRVEVTDGAVESLPVVVVNPDALRGRGLGLVEALADRWGIDVTDSAKCVWFEIPGARI